MIVACFISDRRDLYLSACQKSFWEHVPYGLIKYFNVVDDRHHELGMAGAAKKAWTWALGIGADYLFHIEEDFVFDDGLVPIALMRKVLDDNPHLAQVVLKRQPWSDAEKAAGGQMETNIGAYTQRDGYVEHDTLFSLNPCLIPRRTLELDWPTGHPGGAERSITEECQAAGMRFAYFGNIEDKPRCSHVGHQRAESGWRW